MLSKELSDRLERQQCMALKIIYGFGLSYEALLRKSGVQRLEERRNTACETFTQKLAQSERFNYMFPLNEYPEEMANLRTTKKYKEFHARTARLYNSPLYSMRRTLNRLD